MAFLKDSFLTLFLNKVPSPAPHSQDLQPMLTVCCLLFVGLRGSEQLAASVGSGVGVPRWLP